jgi:hypothetical protein
MAKQKQPDPTVLPASTWQAFVDGWELQNQREIARSQSRPNLRLDRKMQMANGSYAAGSSVPRDPVSGVPTP